VERVGTVNRAEERARRRRRRRRRGPRARVESLLVRACFLPLLLLPPRAALWMARRLGDLTWLLLPSRRRIAIDNLTRAFGDRYDPRERARIGRESVGRFAMTVVEGVLLPRWIASGRLVGLVRDGVGVARVRELHDRREPVIFFAGHIGAWEVGVRHLVREGWRIGVPYRSTRNEVLQDWIVRNRAIAGPEQFPRSGALRPMVRRLARGDAVTMFIDQNERHGIFVDFFGVPAATVGTVGVLAERFGAEVHFQWVRRLEPGRRYSIEFHGPVTIPAGGDPEERVRAWTAAATARIERAVREDPADYLWIHDRWRTRPPEEVGGGESVRFPARRGCLSRPSPVP
jgi:KDO2-lipid IV(A) lauroyltransferase